MLSDESVYDIIIIGAGPAGLSAALNAHQHGLKYILLEKSNHIADTVFCYPKGKPVMAEPSAIPILGDMWLQPALREAVLENWQVIVDRAKLHIKCDQDVTKIEKQQDGSFEVTLAAASAGAYRASKVIYASGTQGNANPLNPARKLPGEGLPHVLTRLKDPAMFVGRDILVVGGGDAAIETAIALAPRNRASIAVRGAEFSPAAKNSLIRDALDLQKKGSLKILFEHEVQEIRRGTVMLNVGKPQKDSVGNANFVFVKIGTQKPRRFLEKVGVEFASSDPNAPPLLKPSSYEASKVAGFYLIGAVCGRGADLIKNAINQGYEVIEQILNEPFERADEAQLRNKLDKIQRFAGSGSVADRLSHLRPLMPLFRSASEDQLRELLLFSDFQTNNPGEIIFHQGEFSESLYMILDGAVDVLMQGADGRLQKVASRKAGEFVGEMNLISARRRAATIRAGTPCAFWKADRKAMLKFIKVNAEAKAIIDKIFVVNAFQSHLFPAVDYGVLARLAETAQVRVYEKGKVIVNEGEPGDAFYFVRSGVVKVSRKSAREERKGKEDTHAYRSAGQYFGEMALLSGEPRMATVSALDRVEVIRLLKDDFLAVLENDPPLRRKFDEEVERRRKASETVERDFLQEQLSDFLGKSEVVVSENALLIDEARCIHCDNCVKACESVHEDGQTRIKRTGMKWANVLVANSCRHCENPLCMTDCPPGNAILRHPSGEVYIDKDKCIACGNCAANCPYDNIFMYHPPESTAAVDKSGPLLFDLKGQAEKPLEPDKSAAPKALAIKCDLCQGFAGGPACERSCPTGALRRLSRDEYDSFIAARANQRRHEIIF